MRQSTLGLFYLVKYMELTFLFVMVGLLISSAVWFIDLMAAQEELAGSDTALIGLISACLVLALFNLLYNNLLINIRFYSKMKCVTFGLCLYDCVNYTICNCFLNKPCRDRCFTPWTIIKWIIKGGIFGATIHLVMQKKSDWEDEFQVGSTAPDPDTTNLDLYLIIYVIQHPIFMLSRIPIFLIYSILTCCCDKGIEFEPNEEFKNRIISFDFVPHELGILNNFENHQVGWAELQYNRRLSFVRANSQRFQNEQNPPPPNQSVIQAARSRLGGTIYATLSGANAAGECGICYMQMRAGDRVCQLACFETHEFHDQCYNTLVDHFREAGGSINCPHCRVPIDQNAVVKKVYKQANPADGKIEEMFALDQPPQGKVENENGFATDSNMVPTHPIAMSPNQPAFPGLGSEEAPIPELPQPDPNAVVGPPAGQVLINPAESLYQPQNAGAPVVAANENNPQNERPPVRQGTIQSQAVPQMPRAEEDEVGDPEDE